MIDLARKDIGIALDLGESAGVTQSIAGTAMALYDRAQADGRGRQDWTALYAMLRKDALGKDSL